MSDSTVLGPSSTKTNRFDILPLSELDTFVEGYDYEYDKKTGLYHKKESKRRETVGLDDQIRASNEATEAAKLWSHYKTRSAATFKRTVLGRVAVFCLNEVATADDTPDDVRLQCEKTLKEEPNVTFIRRLKIDMADKVDRKRCFLSLNTLADSVSTHQNTKRGVDQVDYWKGCIEEYVSKAEEEESKLKSTTKKPNTGSAKFKSKASTANRPESPNTVIWDGEDR